MSDKIHTTCPACQKTLAVPSSVAGKSIRCPSCKGVVAVPLTGDAVIPSAPPVQKRAVRRSPSETRKPASRSKPASQSKSNRRSSTAAARSKPRRTRKKTRQAPVAKQDDEIFDDIEDYQDPFEGDYGSAYGDDAYSGGGLPPRSTGGRRKKKSSSRSSRASDDDDWSDDGDNSPMLQVISGIGMMVGAVVWFVVAYQYANRIFFYPPILFFIGLFTMGKGVVSMFR